MTRRRKPDPREMELRTRVSNYEDLTSNLTRKLLSLSRALDKAIKALKRHRKRLSQYLVEKGDREGKAPFGEGFQ